MKETIAELFGTYAHSIIFLHVLSALIWVGGMIAIRLAVHPNLMLIGDTKLRLNKLLAITGRFFNIVIPFIAILIITAVVMILGMKFNETGYLLHMKEGIWTVMTINFVVMYIRRKKAQKFFDNNQLADAKLTLVVIPKVLLPINIGLGILALWLGVMLRGF